MNDDRLPPIRIPKEMKQRLVQLAQEDGRTLSDYVRRALEQHLKSTECFDELLSKGATFPTFSGDYDKTRFYSIEKDSVEDDK